MHEITIGDDPQASAKEVATLIRSDVKQGTAEPPGPHVAYADGPVSQVKSPAECNADGTGACATLARATAPHVDASHVGVAETTTPSGAKVQHVFLATAPRPGEAPIVLDADGKPVAPVPASRILDPSVSRGMPAPNANLYQGATYAPIWPPGEPDLSHVHAPAPTRAAEGNAYSGDVRLHTPATPEGAAVATASQVAARAVQPPADHVARPVSELYPGHPVLTGVGKTEDWIARQPPFRATAGMVRAWYDALGHVAAGLLPPGTALPDDPKLSAREAEAARQLRGFLELLFQHDAGQPGAAEKLERVQKAVVSVPGAAGDAIRTVVGEADAMLPGVVPAPVRAALVQAAPALDEAPTAVTQPPSRPLLPPPPPPRRAAGLTWLRLPGWSGDREPTNLPLDVALSVAISLPDTLGEWAVGCPGDEYRRPEPPRQIDAHMGAAPAADAPTSAAASDASAPAAADANATPSPFTAPFETGATGEGATAGNWWDAPAGAGVVLSEDGVPPLVDVEETEIPPLMDVVAPLGEIDLFAPAPAIAAPPVVEEVIEEPVVEAARPWWETVVQDVERPFRWSWHTRRRPGVEVVEEPAAAPRGSWRERWFGRERPAMPATPARGRPGVLGTPANVGGHPANAIDPRTGLTYGREALGGRSSSRVTPGTRGTLTTNSAIFPRSPASAPPGSDSNQSPGTLQAGAQLEYMGDGGVYGGHRWSHVRILSGGMAGGAGAFSAAAQRRPSDGWLWDDYVRWSPSASTSRATTRGDVPIRGVAPGWYGYGGDRSTDSRPLTAAIRAYRSDPVARAQLLAGGTVYGLTLGEIRAALEGREEPSPMIGLLGLAPSPPPPTRGARPFAAWTPETHRVPLRYYASPLPATCSTGTCGTGLR